MIRNIWRGTELFLTELISCLRWDSTSASAVIYLQLRKSSAHCDPCCDDTVPKSTASYWQHVVSWHVLCREVRTWVTGAALTCTERKVSPTRCTTRCVKDETNSHHHWASNGRLDTTNVSYILVRPREASLSETRSRESFSPKLLQQLLVHQEHRAQGSNPPTSALGDDLWPLVDTGLAFIRSTH